MRAEFIPGNCLRLLTCGDEYFPALLVALAAAEREIWLESYIFAADAVGESVATALAAAARRGVAVRLVLDGFGARNVVGDFLPLLVEAGVQVLFYRPEIALFRLRRHRLRRLHRKLVLVDNRVGFVGGINIVADDNAPAHLRPRFDFAVEVRGPVLQPLHAALVRLWEMLAWASFRRRFRVRQPVRPEFLATGGQLAAFLVRDNLRHRNDIAQAYLQAIAQARGEILIANAYFLPGRRFRHALRQAAQRGVRVTLLLQGVSDHPWLRYATQALYGTMLRAGIRVFEYRKSFLHAKVAVIDGEWATVGSSNIDPFSLLLAREANLVVRDAAFAGDLRQRLQMALQAGAVELHAGDLARMPWFSRLLRWGSYGLVRFLFGLTGYGGRFWRGGGENSA